MGKAPQNFRIFWDKAARFAKPNTLLTEVTVVVSLDKDCLDACGVLERNTFSVLIPKHSYFWISDEQNFLSVSGKQ